jgi:hypothetical protein
VSCAAGASTAKATAGCRLQNYAPLAIRSFSLSMLDHQPPVRGIPMHSRKASMKWDMLNLLGVVNGRVAVWEISAKLRCFET